MHLEPADFKHFVQHFRVEPGKNVDLGHEFAPDDTAGYKKSKNADDVLEEGIELLAAYQDKLYAENRRALLVVLQAMDAAGKDSTIKHVMSGVNPAGCQVTSFKAPSVEELDHDFLWRCVKALPARGTIGIFNRSHYEEVLVVRVHPEFLLGQRLPEQSLGDGLWKQRFRQINDFERYLVENGVEIVKIFLHVSKEKQRQRQLERIDTPEKNWKFNAGDIKERQFWEAYMAAYQDMLHHTSTEAAPWYVVPADRKWFARIAVAAIIAQKLIDMDPRYPVINDKQRTEMQVSRETLLSEAAHTASS